MFLQKFNCLLSYAPLICVLHMLKSMWFSGIFNAGLYVEDYL